MYAIKCTPNYYGGTINAPQEAYLTWRDVDDEGGYRNNPDGDAIAEWGTEAEAQEVIDALDGPYCLAHGEAGSPGYKIVEDCDDGMSDCLEASGTELHDYREVDADDLPGGVQRALDRLNVEYHTSGDTYDIYMESITVDSVKYAIVYRPRTVALQLNRDDLGGIAWDKAAYFVAD